MPQPDVFLVLQFGQPDRVVAGSFARVAASVDRPLRPVLPWTEWASVDGEASVIRLCGDGAAVSR